MIIKEKIKLLTESNVSIDDYGVETKTLTENEVYVTPLDMYSSEFETFVKNNDFWDYFKFEMFSFEFPDNTFSFIYKTKTYAIIKKVTNFKNHRKITIIGESR